MKFCLGTNIHDVITCAKFGEDRLRGLCVARGHISVFPIDLRSGSLQYYRASG